MTSITRSNSSKDMEERLKVFITEQFNELKEQIKEVQSSQSFINAQFEDLKDAVNNLELRVKRVESVTPDLMVLTKRVEELEQRSRMNNIEVRGLPESPKENCILASCRIGDVLGIENPKMSVIAAHRVPSLNKNVPKPLIIRLDSNSAREKWLSAFRKNKSLTAHDIATSFPKSRVFLNEHLSPHNRKLLADTKKEAKLHGFKYVWTRDAKIFVRREDGGKISRIRNEEDIKNIFNRS